MSEIEGTVQFDHAEYAQQALRGTSFENDWEVVVADDYTLQLDYDIAYEWFDDSEYATQFAQTLGILVQALNAKEIDSEKFRSRHNQTHILVHLPYPMGITQRIAWQAAFGSDPKREALHLRSVSKHELNPILLYMRKKPQPLLPGKPEPPLLTEGEL